MKRVAKYIYMWVFILLMIPGVLYIISAVISLIPVREKKTTEAKSFFIYFNSDALHVDFIIPVEFINNQLIRGLSHSQDDKYFSFGWGDREFYLNTPTSNDMTIKNAFNALFTRSSSLIHLTRYKTKPRNLIKVELTAKQLESINVYIDNTFTKDTNNSKQILENKGYSSNDDFYEAQGIYYCFNTCNTWVNRGLKQAGMKAALWTPFNYGVTLRYK